MLIYLYNKNYLDKGKHIKIAVQATNKPPGLHKLLMNKVEIKVKLCGDEVS